MMEQWALEVVGYVASLLVAISLTMSSILRLRLINLAGAAVFTVYGALIGAYPVLAVNLFIVFVNLYYLGRMRRTREYFRLLEIAPDSAYLRHFLDFYDPQIRSVFPRFTHRPGADTLALFVLRDLVPAGLLLGERQDEVLRVRLDFVIPRYRDFKIGHFLFVEQAAYFHERGIRKVVAPAGTGAHEAYLRRMGFVPGERGEFALVLP